MSSFLCWLSDIRMLLRISQREIRDMIWYDMIWYDMIWYSFGMHSTTTLSISRSVNISGDHREAIRNKSISSIPIPLKIVRWNWGSSLKRDIERENHPAKLGDAVSIEGQYHQSF
jgi:hypothetical protein